ncbi:hypothetical protein G9X67_00830 [Rhizobium sp. WYCCWR 11152]|uniref:hypothetical protein n=1 Tax=Rhizobium sp. WYCCWR 11152 TaxID=2692316 RepID=UPI001492C08B|nr:hypothetical protein [Rhizobium sp. WYCCWR 11152]NNU63828.1 hypothetical protein [Rhizobium sp. WYCCWR 11152]
MSQGNLAGRKVLVVEDNYLQAKTIAEALADHGAEVLGPFPAPEECLPYCMRDQIDAAVLDVKVGEADPFPVADRLVREDIPFIYPHRIRPEHYPSSLQGRAALLEAVRRAGCARSRGARNGTSAKDESPRLKRVAIFQIRLSRFRSLFLRMSLSQNRGTFLRDML